MASVPASVSRELSDTAAAARRLGDEVFGDFAQGLDDVFWVFEPRDRRFLYVSPAYATRWGLGPSALYGDAGQWSERAHPDDRARLQQAVDGLAEGEGYAIEYRSTMPSGDVRWIAERAHALPLRAGDTTARIAGVSRDVSERKTAELGLLDAARRKDEFMAMLAHELRHPLQPIALAAAVLAGLPASAQTHDAAAIIERKVVHLSRLIDDLSDMSYVVQGKLRLRWDVVRLDDVIAAALDACQRRIQQGRLQLRLGLRPEREVWVRGDDVRLTQVFSNLLDNATKFSLPGGVVEVCMRPGTTPAQVVVSVRDEGVGIAADMLPSVFELFAQDDDSLARARGGLGIGLSVVRSLTLLHGGSVEALSAGIGLGSEFIVRLPTTQRPALPRPRQRGP